MRLFVVLVLAVALAGCGPSTASELEKARVRMDLAREEYERLDAKIKQLEEMTSKLPHESRGRLAKDIAPVKSMREEAYDKLQEARDEVARLAE